MVKCYTFLIKDNTEAHQHGSEKKEYATDYVDTAHHEGQKSQDAVALRKVICIFY